MHYNKEYEIILKFIKITRMNIIIGMGGGCGNHFGPKMITAFPSLYTIFEDI